MSGEQPGEHAGILDGERGALSKEGQDRVGGVAEERDPTLGHRGGLAVEQRPDLPARGGVGELAQGRCRLGEMLTQRDAAAFAAPALTGLLGLAQDDEIDLPAARDRVVDGMAPRPEMQGHAGLFAGEMRGGGRRDHGPPGFVAGERRRGFVARDVGYDLAVAASPGGHVLDSIPGLYRGVLSFDFRSLYPSIIRTFCIDPLGLSQPGEDPVPGEDGAAFAREGAILPELVTMLHEARSAAMASKNAALSRAIKILMNSFYGVLGTPGCRFFDPRLPTSITRRGHAIIERARSFFEDAGLPVIYGDTDSLFVHVGDAASEEEIAVRGRALAVEVTRLLAEEIARDLRVVSHLELRFESHYLRFLMPTTRGTDRGSKKRYAGTVRRADGSVELVVRGLEAVRRDWTPLARRVQLELLRRVLSDQPFEEWLVAVARDVVAGRLDDELVYRKRVRRSLDAYARGSSGPGAPPHVQAARMLEAAESEGATTEVEYVMTTRGAEPLELRASPIDHPHYLERQIAPACDVVLSFLGTSFEKLAGAQTSLF